jgi:hypothetical protein
MKDFITSTDYAIIHAPVEIPEWFVHTPPVKTYGDRPSILNTTFKNDEDKEIAHEWLRDGVTDLPVHLQWFAQKLDDWFQKSNEWLLEDHKARFLQWREWFAVNILKLQPDAEEIKANEATILAQDEQILSLKAELCTARELLAHSINATSDEDMTETDAKIRAFLNNNHI